MAIKFLNTATAATQAVGDNSTKIATTAYADAAASAIPIGNYLPLSAGASKPLTGGLHIPHYIYHAGNTGTVIGYPSVNRFVIGTNSVTRVDVTNAGFSLGDYQTNVSVSIILDEDDMASDSATALVTQQSIKAYVDAQTPGAGVFLPLTGGTLSGDLTANGDVLLGGSSLNPKTVTIQQIGVTATETTAIMHDGNGVLKTRNLGTGAFGPTPVGAYLPLSAGSGFPLTGDLYITKAATPLIQLTDTTNSKTLLLGVDDSNAFIRTGSNQNLYLQVSGGTNAITLLNNSNVGIGTDSPGDALVVKGGSAGNIDLVSFQNSAGNETHRFYTDSANDGVIETVTNAGVTANLIQSSGDSYFNGGNVGIGTTSPDTLLHIKGAADDNEALLYVENTHSGGTQYPSAMFTNTNGNHSFGTIAEFRTQNVSGNDRPSILFTNGVTTNNWGVGQGVYSANDNFAIGFRTAHPGVVSAWADPKLVILTSGNVGIGTTNPLTKLHAEGVVTIKGSGTATSGSLAIQDNYGTTDHLGNIGWNRSAGGPYLAYGIKQDGSADWKSTFDNFSGMRSYMKLDNNEMQLAWAPAQQTTVDTVITGLLERFTFQLDSGTLKLNAYDGTDKTGTPTYLLGTDASGNVVKTLSTPGSLPQFNNIRSAAYTSLTGSSDDWFTLFQVTDSMGPVNCKMFTYAHDSLEFSVTEGYGPSNAGSITVINSAHTSNGGFATVSAVRIDQNGYVEVKLVWSSGPTVNIGIMLTGYNAPSLPASLVTSTQTATIVDSVSVDISGLLRSKRQLIIGGSSSSLVANTVKLTNIGDSYINGNSGDKFGIGTDSPTQKLHIKGGDIQTQDTTGLNGVLRIRATITGTPSTGGYPNVGAGDAVIEGGGTSQRQPGVITLMNGDSTISAGQDLGVIQFVGKDDSSTGYCSSQIISTTSGTAGSGASGGGILRFLTSSGNTGSAVEERMRINNSGRVMIGTTTSTSNANLTVKESLAIQSGSSTVLSISTGYGSSFINTGTSGGTVRFGAPTSYTTNVYVQGTIEAVSSVQMGNNTAAASSANAGSTRYRVSGNNSYMDMSMRTGATTYAWVNIVQNNW
jgi:hypothetical protein